MESAMAMTDAEAVAMVQNRVSELLSKPSVRAHLAERTKGMGAEQVKAYVTNVAIATLYGKPDC